MTAPARITQADMDRATKSVRKAGYERARIIMDFVNARIEVIIGGSCDDSEPEQNPWNEE